jgi:hypothetical protein
MLEDKRLRIGLARLVVGLAAAAILIAPAAFAARPVETIEFEPAWDPEDPPEGPEVMPWEESSEGRPPSGPVLEGATWVIRTEVFTARLTQLDAETRWKYIKAKTGAEADPFANTDPDSPGFLTFALELESTTVGDLVLEAQRCRLITNRKEFRHPLDIPTMESSYSLQESKMPPAYRSVAGALIDGEVVLKTGDRGAGLLIYKGVEERTKSFVVEVILTTPEGKIEDHQLPYQRIKKKKRDKHKD